MLQNKKSELLLFRKHILNNGLLEERKIWRVIKTRKYPLGIKYRMVLADPKDHIILLLFDTHWPKGPHIHWESREKFYEFQSVEQLLNDFYQESKKEVKKYDENKKNNNQIKR